MHNDVILLTGATGQVGSALVAALAPLGRVVSPPQLELDLADADSLRGYVRKLRPAWIVNPAAYTAVDKAESEVVMARAINAVAPGVLGEEAHRLGATVLHFSTDYVFDGSGIEPWKEDDPTGPLSVYGQTKLEGEQALGASGCRHLIFRTSWVYSASGHSFLETISKLLRERESLRIVGDQHGAPTSSRALADMSAHVLGQLQTSPMVDRSGVFHAVCGGETTWLGFAQAIRKHACQLTPSDRLAELQATTTAEYRTPATRPLNSRLNCSRLWQSFGYALPPWQESLREVLTERDTQPPTR